MILHDSHTNETNGDEEEEDIISTYEEFGIDDADNERFLDDNGGKAHTRDRHDHNDNGYDAIVVDTLVQLRLLRLRERNDRCNIDDDMICANKHGNMINIQVTTDIIRVIIIR
jgi:hypothetical protein